jgi:hypothetical protein
MLALIRTLARLTSWLGAKVGANVARHPSAPGHIQLLADAPLDALAEQVGVPVSAGVPA